MTFSCTYCRPQQASWRPAWLLEMSSSGRREMFHLNRRECFSFGKRECFSFGKRECFSFGLLVKENFSVQAGGKSFCSGLERIFQFRQEGMIQIRQKRNVLVQTEEKCFRSDRREMF